MDNYKLLKQEQKKIKRLLEHYEYGTLPPKPKHLSLTREMIDPTFAAGKAKLVYMSLKCVFDDGESYSVPLKAAIPAKGEGHPVFLHVKGDSLMPDAHQPTEELCDGGFAVFTVAESDFLPEKKHRRASLAGKLTGQRRRLDSPGRAMMLAWCAMRVMDVLEAEFPTLDLTQATVVGHGAYGISALLAGAFDERFACVITSSAGFGGAASIELARGRLFERKRKHPDLFCGRYYKLSGREDELPFDQDVLLSLTAPRRVLLDNADDLLSHAPMGELVSAYRASKTYENLGITGLLYEKDGNPCEVFDENAPFYLPGGNIVYRKRDGFPYISREDWSEYMNFVLRKGN